MKHAKKFIMAYGATWVKEESNETEIKEWRLYDDNGRYLTNASEVKRNNRGVQLETYLLNGRRMLFWLKPENGKFV